MVAVVTAAFVGVGGGGVLCCVLRDGQQRWTVGPELFAAKFLGPFLLRIPAGEFSTRAGKQDFSAANKNSTVGFPYRRRAY
jgi:hypothetical protein